MGFFSNASNWIKNAAKTVGNGIKKAAVAVYAQSKTIVNTVYNDSKSIVSFAGKEIDKFTDVSKLLINKSADTVQALGSDVKGVASSLSMPLVLAGGAALAFIALKK